VNVIVQQPLVSGGGVSAACVKAGDAHFEEIMAPKIALIASFVTPVDNSISYERRANRTIFL